jgi:hypothetical protein
VFLNGGFGGLYEMIEEVDSPFLEVRAGEEGLTEKGLYMTQFARLFRSDCCL